MKKRVVRLVVYSALIVVTELVLSHPYVRQCAIGPKVKGEPLWAWQEEVRCLALWDQRPPTLLSKVLHFLRLDSEPKCWFDGADPELLPVYLSLADDNEEKVRASVAAHLGRMPADAKTTKTLLLLLNDKSSEVR